MHCFDGDESKSKQSGYVYGAVKGTGDAVYGTSGVHELSETAMLPVSAIILVCHVIILWLQLPNRVRK